tara:strand:+ start:23124 stop:23330 length:207 start_codon:yes stop_codon:yes gene_type:complete
MSTACQLPGISYMQNMAPSISNESTKPSAIYRETDAENGFEAKAVLSGQAATDEYVEDLSASRELIRA